MQDAIRQLKNQFDTDYKQTLKTGDFDELYLKYFSKTKGLITLLMKETPNLTSEQKREVGPLINTTQNEIKTKIDEGRAEYANKKHSHKQSADYSIPNRLPNVGSLHPVTHSIFEVEDILGRIGFSRRRYRESETDWYAFEALNMPQDHAARDEWETFYLVDGNLLTPHTSNGQIREMETKKPPIKMLNIAKTYRRQSDVSHSPMFHQFEGLYIDKNVSIAQLKGTLDYFIKLYFGPNRQTRIRPYNFRFTEPSFEVDISCNKCNGEGCKLCKRGWLELGGAGMVHPNVLKAVGIDTTEYNGFAFGFGVERPYMMKGDINIPDIRMMYETDLEFLRNF
jgi:phenylalanyl-tRNA synthetase alpha chain